MTYNSAFSVVTMSYAEKSQFHTLLSEITDRGIIGMDYIIEAHIGNSFESNFHCVLCEENYNLKMAVGHLSTYAHRMKYLEKHFPTAFYEICKMEKREKRLHFLEKVCQGIEDKYGRPSEKFVKNTEFLKNKLKFIDEVAYADHIDEKLGQTFVELFTESYSSTFEDYADFDATFITNERSTSSIVKSSDGASTGSSPLNSNSKRNSQYNDKRHYRSNNSYNSYRRKYESSRKPQVEPKDETRIQSPRSQSPRSQSSRTQSPRTRSRSPQRHMSRKCQPASLSIRSPNNYGRNYKSIPPVTSQSYKNEASTSQFDSWRKSPNSVETSNLTTSSSDEINDSSSNEIYSRRRYYDTEDATTELFKRRTPVSIDEPVTVMSVLRLLTAFEDILGSLGPKVIELITEAITMNKVKENSSNLLLDNHERSIVFETILHKLNGLLSCGSIEPNKIPAVRKTINNMTTIIDEANERRKTNILSYVPVTRCEVVKTETSLDDQSSPFTEYDRAAIAGKIVIALIKQGRREEDISQVEIGNNVEKYITMASAKRHKKIYTSKESTASLDETLYDPFEALPMPSEKAFDSWNENHSMNRHGSPKVLPLPFKKTINAVNKNQSIHHPEVLRMPPEKAFDARNDNHSINCHGSPTVLPLPLNQSIHHPEVVSMASVKTFDAKSENHSINRHDCTKVLSVSSDKKVVAANENESIHRREASKVLPMFYVKKIDARNENNSINSHDAPERLPTSTVTIDARNAKLTSNRQVRMLKELSPINLLDSDLKNLVQNFTLLPDNAKQSVIKQIKEIEKNDPERMRNFENLYKNDILNSMCYKEAKEHQK